MGRTDVLGEILDRVTVEQRRYVIARGMGLGEGEAREMVKVGQDRVEMWRKQEGFRWAERKISEGGYWDECKVLLLGELRPKALLVLAKLVEKGMDFEGQEEKLWPYIYRACIDSIKYADTMKVRPKGKVGGGGYEELVYKVRREIEEREPKLIEGKVIDAGEESSEESAGGGIDGADDGGQRRRDGGGDGEGP